MRRVVSVFLIFMGVFWLTKAQAAVQIDIDLSRQSMTVSSASGDFTWPISSARSGYSTPNGRYAPYSLQRMHYSHKYHMSPMPYSIFFSGGYAIHGTASVAELGRPASHGCIRLAPAQAAKLFQMVKAEGASIAITGEPPHHLYAKAKTRHYAATAKIPAASYAEEENLQVPKERLLPHYAAAKEKLHTLHVAAHGDRAYTSQRRLRQSAWGGGFGYAPSRQLPDYVRAYDDDGAYGYERAYRVQSYDRARANAMRDYGVRDYSVRAWQYAPAYGW